MVAEVPLLNFKKSDSMPSLKITPLFGISDSIVKCSLLSMTPSVVSVCVRTL
jgi:hypothetical protein